jgi:phospholipid/cholesterol/gamma-HCH transport system substrate-binding protein
MSRKLTRFQAAFLGALVIMTLALGGAGLMVLNDRNGWGSDNFRVHAGFPDVGGVEVGTRVRIQGMDAGEIEAIEPPDNPGEPVRLRLRIIGKFRHLVRDDARVQIASEALLAGKVVRILPGSAGARVVDDHAELKSDVQPDVMEGIAVAANKLNKLLVEVDDAMQTLRKNDGSVTQDLINATKKLNVVLAKADTALDRIEKGEGTLGKLIADDTLYAELTETLGVVKGTINDVRYGEGTLGKLVKSNEAYSEAVASLQDVRRMVNSVKQNSDAIKALPVVRSYVIDYNKELIRPECKRYRWWFAESVLFEPGKAVLTAKGKERLDDAGDWLKSQQYPGSEILVAVFAEPTTQPDFAQTVTQKQGEVVKDYLKGQHQVHRTGWWWWSTRSVRSIGCGNTPSPIPDSDKLPAARVELIVFVPQK